MDMEDDEPQQQERNPKKRFRKNKLKLVFDPEERKNFLLGFRKRKQERKEKYIEKLERDLAKEKKRIKQQTQRQAKKMSSSHSILPEVQSIIDSIPEREETYDLGNTLVKITSLDDQIYRNLPVIKEEDEESEDEEELERRKNDKLLKQIQKRKKANQFGGESDEDNDEISKTMKNDPFFNAINDEELSRSDLSEEEEDEKPYDPMALLRQNTAPQEELDPSKQISKAKLERQANRMLQESDVYKKMQKVKQKRSKKFRLFRLQPTESSTEGGPKNKTKGAGKGGKNIVKGKNKGRKRK